MANVVNERDKIMQNAPLRTVPVAPTVPVIVEGVTGIRIIADAGAWASTPSGSPYWIAPSVAGKTKMSYAAVLSGMSPAPPVTWKLGRGTATWDATRQEYIPTSFTELPFGYSAASPDSVHGIILTPTVDPLIREIDSASYPRTAAFPPNSNLAKWKEGAIYVSCTYASKLFWTFRWVGIVG